MFTNSVRGKKKKKRAKTRQTFVSWEEAEQKTDQGKVEAGWILWTVSWKSIYFCLYLLLVSVNTTILTNPKTVLNFCFKFSQLFWMLRKLPVTLLPSSVPAGNGYIFIPYLLYKIVFLFYFFSNPLFNVYGSPQGGVPLTPTRSLFYSLVFNI